MQRPLTVAAQCGNLTHFTSRTVWLWKSGTTVSLSSRGDQMCLLDWRSWLDEIRGDGKCVVEHQPQEKRAADHDHDDRKVVVTHVRKYTSVHGDMISGISLLVLVPRTEYCVAHRECSFLQRMPKTFTYGGSMLIAVDVDDVLFPSTPVLFRWHNQRYGSKLTPGHRTSFYLERVWGGNQAEAILKVGEFYDTVSLVEFSPIPGAQEVLTTLRKKHELIAVSARFRRHADLTRQWLDAHFKGYFSQVVLTSYGEPDAIPKAHVCRDLEVGCLIDDHIDHATECAALGTLAVVFGEYAWNRGNHLPATVLRAKHWQDVAHAAQFW